MPLIRSSNPKAISQNIREMQSSGHQHNQAVAAALHMADKMKKYDDGGIVNLTPDQYQQLQRGDRNAGFSGTATPVMDNGNITGYTLPESNYMRDRQNASDYGGVRMPIIQPTTPSVSAPVTPPTPQIAQAPNYAQFAAQQANRPSPIGTPSLPPAVGASPAVYSGGSGMGMSPATAGILQSIYSAPAGGISAAPTAKSGGVQHMGIGGMPMSEEVPWFERRETGAGMPHSGLLNSSVAGRTDRLPIAVATDSYVMPADVVSGLGQGNTLAGARILNEALRTGPWGTSPGGDKIAHGNLPKPPHAFNESSELSRGGHARHMPIIAAGGEFVVPPEAVLRVGQGDMKKGHRILDEMVRRVREHTVKKISSLPKPKK